MITNYRILLVALGRDAVPLPAGIAGQPALPNPAGEREPHGFNLAVRPIQTFAQIHLPTTR